MKKIIFAFAMLSLLVACTTTKTIRTLTYELDCSNCGNSQDGYVKIEINRYSYPDDFMILNITNNKDEILLLEEKMFCLSYNDTLAMNPISFNNPYLTVSASKAEVSTASKSYLILDRYSSYFEGQKGSQDITSHSFSRRYPDYLSIPPKTTVKYYIRSILDEKFDLIKTLNTHLKERDEIYVQWDSVQTGLKELNNDNFKIAIAYKMVSEERLKSSAISVKAKNVHLDEKIVK